MFSDSQHSYFRSEFGWPPELSDYLIDHIWDSKSALASCSLVCRTWVNRSRYHLFQEVDISVKRCPKLDVFLAFLRSSPHLSSYIRSLTLRGTIASDEISYAVWYYVSSQTLLDCLEELPHIVELSLRGIRLTGDIRDGRTPLRQASVQRRLPLQRLLLSNVFVHPDRLFNLLHLFPQLRILTAAAIYWTLDHEPSGEATYHGVASPSLPMLHSVTFGAESSYQMLAYFLPRLQRSIDVTAMRCLTLYFDRLDPCPETAQFMDCAGPGLRTLHIKIGKRARVAAVGRFVDMLKLGQCTALVEFAITLEATFSRSKDPTSAWSLLLAVISKLPKTVRLISITHRLDSETLSTGLCSWNWPTFDAELSTRCLSRVVIRSSTQSSDKRADSIHVRDVEYTSHSHAKPSDAFFIASLPLLSNARVLELQSF